MSQRKDGAWYTFEDKVLLKFLVTTRYKNLITHENKSYVHRGWSAVAQDFNKIQKNGPERTVNSLKNLFRKLTNESEEESHQDSKKSRVVNMFALSADLPSTSGLCQQQTTENIIGAKFNKLGTRKRKRLQTDDPEEEDKIKKITLKLSQIDEDIKRIKVESKKQAVEYEKLKANIEKKKTKYTKLQDDHEKYKIKYVQQAKEFDEQTALILEEIAELEKEKTTYENQKQENESNLRIVFT